MLARQLESQDLVPALQYMATKLRRHSIEMTAEAGSGHPTTCLSAADLVAALFFHEMRYDVEDPNNPDNDRFVLSKGHGAPLLYAVWAEAGAIDPASLLSLRRIDSDLEGHPTPRFAWAEAATGSLGQGLSVGAGMAVAAKIDGRDYRTFVLMGDGETAEGAIWEAAEVAAHRELDNLVGIVDVNRLGQSDPTMLEHDMDAYVRRFEAFGWDATRIDGHDFSAILEAYERARQRRGRPHAILARTLKGKGVSFLEDEDGWHGKALEKGEQTEKALAELTLEGDDPHLEMRAPEPAAGASAPRAPGGPVGLGRPDYDRDKQEATRTAYGNALAKLGEIDPRVVALDGDVKNSTYTQKFAEKFPDRFVEGYIAEQNLVGMSVGLQARGKLPFFATFACFLTRASDMIRMAGISQADVKLCGSHAGISIGEDGPSQMGLEDLAMMRAIPGSVVLYPCDAVSAERMVALAAAYHGISYIRTTRPKTPVIYDADESFELGGFKVHGAGSEDRLTVVAAGVTVHEALQAQERLAGEHVAVRVIDLYCIKPLDADALVKQALETDSLVLTVEDHYAEGGLGEAVASALAPYGVRVRSLAVRELPRSGKPEELLAKYGIDSAAIVTQARELVRSGRG